MDSAIVVIWFVLIHGDCMMVVKLDKLPQERQGVNPIVQMILA